MIINQIKVIIHKNFKISYRDKSFFRELIIPIIAFIFSYLASIFKLIRKYTFDVFYV